MHIFDAPEATAVLGTRKVGGQDPPVGEPLTGLPLRVPVLAKVKSFALSL